MVLPVRIFQPLYVALRKESVDRNLDGISETWETVVALRKESVDRNCYAFFCPFGGTSRSPQGERG